MVIELERAVKRAGYEAAIAKWELLLEQLPDYRFDADGALREWATSEYIENNNHRHLSHLYAAWPAYETQTDPKLAKAAAIALENGNKYNTGDATAGHGWMHKALVSDSLMTDHDTDRRCRTYCTDTLFGTVGAVNEALLFSNTGMIEVLPALPSDWRNGSIQGLMARTRAEIKHLKWDLNSNTVTVTLQSLADCNPLRLKSGIPWNKATLDGREAKAMHEEGGSYVPLTLDEGSIVTVVFTLEE